MVTIITGKIDSGKTTRLLSIFHTLKSGDGFALKKVYADGIPIGQNIHWLSMREYKPFSIKRGYLPEIWDEAYSLGPYSFSANGLAYAGSIIIHALKHNAQPLYIDEIGPLELENKGFAQLLNLALECHKDIYITVRDNCLDAVAKKFNIGCFRLLNV